MTIQNAIELVDSLTYNQIDMMPKIKWLSDLDRTVQNDILLAHEGTDNREFNGYGPDQDLETELLVPAPYDEIYRWYLEMKIHDTTGEITKYNNAAAKYNAAYIAYADYINRKHTPKGMRNIKIV